MFKIFKSKKAYSLVEVLVLTAVIGVCGALVTNVYSDTAQTVGEELEKIETFNVQNAMRVFLAETATADIVASYERFKTKPDDNADNVFSVEDGVVLTDNLKEVFKSNIYKKNTRTGRWEQYGPYLQTNQDVLDN